MGISPLPPVFFWQARYYDFNVWTERKCIEQLRYIHRNPVKRGLCGNPEDCPALSSFFKAGDSNATLLHLKRQILQPAVPLNLQNHRSPRFEIANHAT